MPKDIQKRINLEPGDRPDLLIYEGGRFLVPPATVDVSELVGMLERLARAVTVTEMNQAIHKRGGYL
ncbi:MAG: AbrB family transcriptional regulator [Nitrospira sp.]|nr:MAG: AbrB family transcriptional regulator [Nitrospira sp.]